MSEYRQLRLQVPQGRTPEYPTTLTLNLFAKPRPQILHDIRAWVRKYNFPKDGPITSKKLGYNDGIVWWWGAGTWEKENGDITLFFGSEEDKVKFILKRL